MEMIGLVLLTTIPDNYLQITNAASTYQPLDGDLTAIAGLSGSTGLLRKTGTNTWSIDTASYLTSNASINALNDVDVITNPPQENQVLKWNGTNWAPAADVSDGGTGNVTFSENTINVSNANPLTITPVLTLSNNLNATNINLTGTITSQASGTPEIVSDNEILLDAGTRVELVGSPIKMANLTTGQRDEILAENGDVIYNLSTNKFQGYANGVWVDLH
jgi:hypothetical protein